MFQLGHLLEALSSTLTPDAPEDTLRILQALGGHPEALVRLPEGDLTVRECLDYAAVLEDLGRSQDASELLRAATVASWAPAAEPPNLPPVAYAGAPGLA